MNKRCFTSLLFFLCSTTAAGFSMYNGNPSLPEMPEDGYLIPKNCWLGIKVGYLGDMVFSRSMIVHVHGESEASHQISSFESYMNGGTFTIGFANRVDLYGVLGSYRLKVAQRLEDEYSVHFASDHHLAGIVGARAIVATWGDTHLGVDAKGLISYPEIDSMQIEGYSLPPGPAKFHDRQWQIGVSLSHQVSFFIPYIGLTYSHARLKLTGLSSLTDFLPSEEIRLQNKYSFGFVFGFGLVAEKAFAFNLEGRIIEETGATVSADFKF